MRTTFSIQFENEELPELRRVVNRDAAFSVLHDFAQEIRKKLKYEQLTEEQSKVWEEVHKCFWDLCGEEKIDPMGD